MGPALEEEEAQLQELLVQLVLALVAAVLVAVLVLPQKEEEVEGSQRLFGVVKVRHFATECAGKSS